MSSNPKNIPDQEISLRDLFIKIHNGFYYVWSKWLTLIFIGIIGGILGFAYAYFKTPQYVATTTFVLESGEGSAGGLGQYSGLASLAGIDINTDGGGIFQGENIFELYKSRNMIEKSLLTPLFENSDSLIIDRYINMNKLREKWIENPKLAQMKFKKYDIAQINDTIPLKNDRVRDSILENITENINKNYLTVGKPDKRLAIIRVDVKSKDEVFSKAFNDAIVKNVNDFYVQTRTKKSMNNLQILQRQTDSVRSVMNGNIYTAASISDATPNLNPTRQIQRVAPTQRAQFSAETNKAILSSLVQNLEMTKMTLLKETPLIQVLDSPRFPLQYQKLSVVKGTVIGAFLAGIFGVLFFLTKRVFKAIMRE